jgi:uncharacterized protein (TIGR02646 family)
MKRIRKTNPPQELLEWIQVQQKDKLECNYQVLQGKPAHIALKEKLLKEQGYLCAYTGIKISVDTSHMEHLKPRKTCTEIEEVDYRNVVACFPKDENDTPCSFGAKPKGDWWNEEEFVSPCQENCERRFSFSWQGTVSPTLDNDDPVKITIEKLGLNKDPDLSEENNQTGEYHVHDRRRDAIKAFFGFSKNPKIASLTKREAEILLRTIYKTDANGHLKQFCFVLKHLLERYIK